MKTYEEIENYLESDSKDRKQDKKNNKLFYDNCGLGGKINKFLKLSSDELNESCAEKEKEFLKQIDIPKSIYLEIKSKILKELKNDRSKY